MKTTLLLTLAGIAIIPTLALASGNNANYDRGAKYGNTYTQNRDAYQHGSRYESTHYRSADSRYIGTANEFNRLEVPSLRRSGGNATGGANPFWY